jgi:hypothetical protein
MKLDTQFSGCMQGYGICFDMSQDRREICFDARCESNGFLILLIRLLSNMIWHMPKLFSQHLRNLLTTKSGTMLSRAILAW